MPLVNQKMRFYFLTIIFILIEVTAYAQTSDGTILDFKLLNVDKEFVSLSQYPDAKGFIIVFTCNHCPFAKLYPDRLNALYDHYMPLGVPLIAISSTDTILYEEDGFMEMIERARDENYHFPYLFDAEQTVARNFFAQKTPHAYVIWKIDGRWQVRYSGAIDDNGLNPEKVTQPFVAMALEALLAGKQVPIQQTGSIGCQILFRK